MFGNKDKENTRDEQHEADQVVAEIMDHKLRKRTRFGDYAILYRGNHQSRLIELALQQQQMPYHLSGGTSFFARNEVRDIMAYLRLLLNEDDDNAFLRIANVPRRKLETDDSVSSRSLDGLGMRNLPIGRRHISTIIRFCNGYNGRLITLVA